MHLAGGDHGREPTVESGLDEVHRALPRREVAEHWMAVRVDETGNHRGAVRVDHRVGIAVEAPPDGDELALLDHERVTVEERPLDVSRYDLADALDEGAHGGCS